MQETGAETLVHVGDASFFDTVHDAIANDPHCRLMTTVRNPNMVAAGWANRYCTDKHAWKEVAAEWYKQWALWSEFVMSYHPTVYECLGSKKVGQTQDRLDLRRRVMEAGTPEPIYEYIPHEAMDFAWRFYTPVVASSEIHVI